MQGLERVLGKIADRPNVRLVMKSFSYFFSEKMTRVFVGFFLQAWLARHLGPERMGIYSYVVDFAAIFVPIVLFGFDDIIVKDLVRSEEAGKILGTVFYFRLVLGIAVWLVLCLSIWIIRKEAMEIVYFTMLFGTTVIYRCIGTFAGYFHANFLFKTLIRTRQQAYIISSTLKAVGLWYGLGIGYFLANAYLQNLLERVFMFFAFRKISTVKLYFDKTYFRSLLPLCLPIALTSFFALAEARMGTFFLSKYWDLSSVGEFGAGRALLEIWDFLPTTICISVFPIIVKSKDLGSEVYFDKLRKLYATLFYLGLAFALSVTFTAPWVIRILYGSQYDQTASVLSYGSYLALITYINLARVKWYILENKTGTWLAITATTFALNFGLQFYFTKNFSVTGPAMASITSHIVGNLLVGLFSKTTRMDLKNVFQGILFPFKVKL